MTQYSRAPRRSWAISPPSRPAWPDFGGTCRDLEVKSNGELRSPELGDGRPAAAAHRWFAAGASSSS